MTDHILSRIVPPFGHPGRRPRRKIFGPIRFRMICLSAAALCLALPARAAPEPWQIWQDHDPHSTQQVDHTAWQEFLDAFVVGADDGINRVAYQQARANAQPQLQRYLAQLAATDPRPLNDVARSRARDSVRLAIQTRDGLASSNEPRQPRAAPPAPISRIRAPVRSTQ